MTETTSVTYSEECFDLPALPSNNLSVSFYNVPTALLMRWMVGEPSDQQKEEMAQVLSGEQKHPTMGSPFKSVFFIILFIAGILMSLTIPSFATLIFLWRRKKEASYVQHDDVTFFVLNGVLIAASVLAGLFALILICNNEKITVKPSQLVNRFNIYKRVEEHKEKLLCIMDHSFESHEEEEVQRNANDPKVEKMATVLLNTYGAEEILQRKQKVDGVIKSIKSKVEGTNEACEEMNRLLKQEISRTSLVTTLLSIYESEPVEDKEEIILFKRVMERTVEVLATELEHYQGKAAEVVLKILEDSPRAISWVAVMFAMLIACLFAVVKALFVVSLYSQESFTVDIIKRMSIRCVTTSIAILGIVMFVLFICGAYNGFIMMLRGKSVPGEYQAFWVMNLSLVEDHRYDFSLSEFFKKCEEGSNLIDAFGTWRFLNSEFMQKLGLELDHARKNAAKPNLKKFTEYIESLIKQVEAAKGGYTLIKAKDPKAVAKHAAAEDDFKKLNDALKKMTAISVDDLQMIPEDVNAGKKNPTTRIIAEQALDKAKREVHKCDDILSLWIGMRSKLVIEIASAIQGQWIACAFLGMFALCTFIAATLGAIILDGIENSIKSGGNPVTQAKSHAPSVAASVTPKSRLDQNGFTPNSVTPTSKQEGNADKQAF